MMISQSRVILATTLTLILSSFGSSVLANPNSTETESHQSNDPSVITHNNVQDLFQEAITYESGNFFTNRSVGEQLQLIFGVGGVNTQGLSAFPENEIARDARLLHTIYEDYLQQQVGQQPIRTRDLKNPYTASLRSLRNVEE